jgi:2-C-methyl-D-erythritol 2,4-cyclodiphosphate synthase
MKVRTGLGQDSHRFCAPGDPKELRLGGVFFDGELGLEGNSDADVVLHALANALSGLSGENIMGDRSDALCAQGVSDSKAYVREAFKTLGKIQVSHVSVSLECAKPKISPKVPDLRRSIAALLNLEVGDVAVTATSGEGLTAFGKGEGIQAIVLVTGMES